GVNDVPGGGGEFGTITPDGVYTAPEQLPACNEVCITAAIDDGGRQRELWATVVIGPFNPEYTRVATWPTGWGGPGEFSPLDGVYLDADGNLIIASKGTERLDADGNPIIASKGPPRVCRLSPQGKYLDELDPSPEQFKGPREATVDAQGDILIADGDKGRVFRFDRSGKFITAWGEKGTGPGQLSRPHGIVIGRHGRIYIVDVNNGRVQVYAPSGEFLFEWGTHGSEPGQFMAPHGIAVDPNGDIFVCEWWGRRCQRFTPEGGHLKTFAVLPGDGERAYHSITCDRHGNLYLGTKGIRYVAAEGARHPSWPASCWPSMLNKYNNEGDFITSIALRPTPERRHYRPSSAVVAKDGHVYVADGARDNAGIDVFAPALARRQ
ncbi:MAG TPA: NHL repeat-containing protein, partial [Armatimonadota bacterium]|nr:NHL repeat-containing protein [Armatimonadota bacterium]